MLLYPERGFMVNWSAGCSTGLGASLWPWFGDHAVHATVLGCCSRHSIGHVSGVAGLKQSKVSSCSSQLTHLWILSSQDTELCVPLGISLAPLMLTLASL